MVLLLYDDIADVRLSEEACKNDGRCIVVKYGRRGD